MENKEIVFNINWFKKHQKKLLWLLNTPIVKIWFRWVLRIRLSDCPTNEKIIEILPNNFTYSEKRILVDFIVFKNGKREILDLTKRTHKRLYLKSKIEKGIALQRKTDFRTHDKYAKRLYFAFKPLWYLFHVIDWVAFDRYEKLARLSFGFSTLTVYPDADPETNSVDGTLNWGSSTSTESWSTIRAKTESTSANDNSAFCDSGRFVYARYISGAHIEMSRAVTGFYTGTLGTATDISSAVISVKPYDKKATSINIGIVGCSLASNTALVVGDFDSSTLNSPTEFITRFASGDCTVGTYKDISLNSNGLNYINKTGTTNFMWRSSYDIDNTSPGSIDPGIGVYFADNTGTTNDPKLVITYTVTTTAPTVTTQDASSITNDSCVGNGNITNTGGENATRRGFCYLQGSSGDPTTANSVVYDDGSFGTGAYTKAITGLTPNTTYRVRAYAVNSAGTSYGSTVSFTTLKADESNFLLLF